MTRLDPWLFVSDVDDTLLGDEIALGQLAEILKPRPNLTLAYNSSRPCSSLRETLAMTPFLPVPHYLIGALGTEIQAGASGERLVSYENLLHRASTGQQIWDRERIVRLMDALALSPHPLEFQTPFKVSYDLFNPNQLERIIEDLAAAGQEVKVVYSGGKNLDIIPQVAGKGSAITFLQRWLGLPPERVVVAGDSGNDVDMFMPPYRGIVVANATAELKAMNGTHIYHAQAAHAAGIIEGLRFWGVIQ